MSRLKALILAETPLLWLEAMKPLLLFVQDDPLFFERELVTLDEGQLGKLLDQYQKKEFRALHLAMHGYQERCDELFDSTTLEHAISVKNRLTSLYEVIARLEQFVLQRLGRPFPSTLIPIKGLPEGLQLKDLVQFKSVLQMTLKSWPEWLVFPSSSFTQEQIMNRLFEAYEPDFKPEQLVDVILLLHQRGELTASFFSALSLEQLIRGYGYLSNQVTADFFYFLEATSLEYPKIKKIDETLHLFKQGLEAALVALGFRVSPRVTKDKESLLNRLLLWVKEPDLELKLSTRVLFGFLEAEK